MYYIITWQMLGGKYSHWIVILQEFELEFGKITLKKSLFFTKLICDLPCTTKDTQPFDSLPNKSLFLISMTDPWYGDIILYLQTLRYQPVATGDEHR